MDLGLKGAKALVTGGTKGIGRAIVETLAAEGCDVAFCARNADEVAAATAAFAAHGTKVIGQVLDVADAAGMAGWVADSAASLGGIDIVVANVSALAIPGDEAGWQSGFATDMMGTVRFVNAAMPWLEKSDKASIVTIASVSGREIDFAAGPYGAFKAAMSTTHRASRITWPARASGPTPCRPATPTSPAASGTRSSAATPNSSSRHWR